MGTVEEGLEAAASGVEGGLGWGDVFVGTWRSRIWSFFSYLVSFLSHLILMGDGWPDLSFLSQLFWPQTIPCYPSVLFLVL